MNRLGTVRAKTDNVNAAKGLLYVCQTANCDLRIEQMAGIEVEDENGTDYAMRQYEHNGKKVVYVMYTQHNRTQHKPLTQLNELLGSG